MHLAEHYYHVYNRGCNQERIFANQENYVFLQWVEQRDRTLVDKKFVRQYFPTATDYEKFVLSEVKPALEEKLKAYYLD